ncbi:GIY-YIG nuclease family protein [Sphingomonas sp. AX6]|uniref:GIY-YIG nuclease family protein n=1 Tax=Sphingomonas sp. AX6 TaxID=2653171 RepID=UPI00135AA8A5|nr:GIY-YIG nuclease family protein [Sphingomonas sp. AX6]
MARQPCVYILASGRCGTLYTGVTSDIIARVYQHREGLIKGFTSRYGVMRLVWFEMHDTMDMAITREKRIKQWDRDWKLNLIEHANPGWDDLAIGFGFEPIATTKIMDSRLRGNDEGTR